MRLPSTKDCEEFLTRCSWKKKASATPVRTKVRFCDSGKIQTLVVKETRSHVKSVQPWKPDRHGNHSGGQRRPVPRTLTLNPLPKCHKCSSILISTYPNAIRKLRDFEICKGLLQLLPCIECKNTWYRRSSSPLQNETTST